MTAETGREVDLFLDGYADARIDALRASSHARICRSAQRSRLGPLRLIAGRSGHVAGGVWCAVDDGRHTFGYCGDVVPASPVFAMDPLPRCDAIALDASYGDDDVTAHAARERRARLGARAQPGLRAADAAHGRSAELLAIVPGAIALSPGMREALQLQIADPAWLAGEAADAPFAAARTAADWQMGAPLPRAALLCHDGMGMAGPSREVLALAAADGHPMLFTGHVPADSPGERDARRRPARRGCGCRRIRPCPRTSRSSRTARRKPSSVIRASARRSTG